jgi:hypothetical protein
LVEWLERDQHSQLPCRWALWWGHSACFLDLPGCRILLACSICSFGCICDSWWSIHVGCWMTMSRLIARIIGVHLDHGGCHPCQFWLIRFCCCQSWFDMCQMSWWEPGGSLHLVLLAERLIFFWASLWSIMSRNRMCCVVFVLGWFHLQISLASSRLQWPCPDSDFWSSSASAVLLLSYCWGQTNPFRIGSLIMIGWISYLTLDHSSLLLSVIISLILKIVMRC